MGNISQNIGLLYRQSIRNLTGKRAIIAVLMVTFLQFIYLEPLKQISKELKYYISPWVYPHLFSKAFFLMLFTFCMIYFYSKSPFDGKHGFYQYVRMGKQRWCLIHSASIIVCGFAFQVLFAMISVILLLPRLYLTNEWGKILYTVGSTDIGAAYGLAFGIDYGTMIDYGAGEIMIKTLVTGGLVMGFLGLFIFFLSLYHSLLAVSAASILAIMPVVLFNLPMNVRNFLYYLSPLSWMQITSLNKREFAFWGIPSTWYSIPVLILLHMILVVLILKKVNRTDIVFRDEE